MNSTKIDVNAESTKLDQALETLKNNISNVKLYSKREGKVIFKGAFPPVGFSPLLETRG